MKFVLSLITLAALSAQAQMIKIPDSFSRLAEKADDVVEVTLDANTLGLASRFLNDKDPDQASARKIVNGLKGIWVKSYTFNKEGEYSSADVDALRSQMTGNGWSCIVNVRSKKKGDNAQVCFHSANGKVTGLGIIATEPKELTIVSIAGSIDPDQLGALEGQFGIPKMSLDMKSKKSGKDKDKDKDEEDEE